MRLLLLGVLVLSCVPCFAHLPILIIPGIGGTKLQVFNRPLDRPCTTHGFVDDIYVGDYRNRTNFPVWLNLDMMAYSEKHPTQADPCLYLSMNQTWNNITHTASDQPGWSVDIVYHPSNSFWDINFLAEPNPGIGDRYFATLVDWLVNRSTSYTIDKDLKGFPYDWRYGPRRYYAQLQSTIESFSASNKQSPIFVVAHSMGNLYFHQFMTTMPSAWKKQYIAGYAAIAAPWYGAIDAAKGLLSGTNFNLPNKYLNETLLRPVMRTFESIYYLFPHATMWPVPLPIVVDQASGKFYNPNDALALFNDAGLPQYSRDIYNWIPNYKANPETDPGINSTNVLTIFGTLVNTSRTVVYPNGFADSMNFYFLNSSGDGTVLDIGASPPWVLFSNRFPVIGATHKDILFHEETYQYIVKFTNRIGVELGVGIACNASVSLGLESSWYDAQGVSHATFHININNNGPTTITSISFLLEPAGVVIRQSWNIHNDANTSPSSTSSILHPVSNVMPISPGQLNASTGFEIYNGTVSMVKLKSCSA